MSLCEEGGEMGEGKERAHSCALRDLTSEKAGSQEQEQQ